MAIFVVLSPYLLTTKLRCQQKNNFEYTNLGVDKITTLEYASQNNEHPKINLVTPEELRKSILKGDVPQFDGMVTFSSLEHSGLGRYGDPLNPWGDLITMAQAWCLLKPGLYSFKLK